MLEFSQAEEIIKNIFTWALSLKKKKKKRNYLRNFQNELKKSKICFLLKKAKYAKNHSKQ